MNNLKLTIPKKIQPNKNKLIVWILEQGYPNGDLEEDKGNWIIQAPSKNDPKRRAKKLKSTIINQINQLAKTAKHETNNHDTRQKQDNRILQE